jgi:uncharacterized membrane protein
MDVTPATPTIPPPNPRGLNSSLRRNIEALARRRERESASATREERTAQAITNFTGSMWFVYIHLALYGAWILLNLGVIPGLPKFDPSFVILATEASVEAIFLSTFVLISQNRTAAAADKRADLDLQISLLAEHELTKLAQVVAAIADRLGVAAAAQDPELAEVERDVAPEAVLDAIERRGKAG